MRMRHSLVKAEVLGLGTNAVVALLSAAQTVVVIRLLSPEEYGLVGLVLSVTSVVGVFQQLGIRVASVREMSEASNLADVSKVLWTSIFARVCLSLPIAAFLFLSAGYFGDTLYQQPTIRLPIQILAVALLVTNVNALLEGMLTALQRFVLFYGYLIFAFVLRLLLYASLVYRFRLIGYFWAEFSWVALLGITLSFLAARQLGRQWTLPTREDFCRILKSVFGLSMVLYVARILHSFWQRSGLLLLGFFVAEAQLGYFNLGLSFAGQLLTVSGAISQVYLPTMTRLFNTDRAEFVAVLESNFIKVVSVLFLAVASMLLFAREVVLFLAKEPYLPALVVFTPLTLAFLVQALFNVISSGLLIPARQERGFLLSVALGRTISVALTTAFVILGGGIVGAGWGAFLGLLPGLILMEWVGRTRVGIRLWRWSIGVLMLVISPLVALSFLDIQLRLKVPAFAAIVFAYVLACHQLDVFRFQTLQGAFQRWLNHISLTRASGGK